MAAVAIAEFVVEEMPRVLAQGQVERAGAAS